MSEIEQANGIEEEGPMSVEPSMLSVGVQLIAAERERQVNVEGWTPEHDDAHTNGELSTAAVCYAATSAVREVIGVGALWPWSFADWKPSANAGRVRELAKAGALIAAEIDRLTREVP